MRLLVAIAGIYNINKIAAIYIHPWTFPVVTPPQQTKILRQAHETKEMNALHPFLTLIAR